MNKLGRQMLWFIPCLETCNLLSTGCVLKIYILLTSVNRKKLPNVYKSCPKMISIEKSKILIPLQQLPTNVGDLG